ncbi:tetratricopeptide (TPR) repeat protein [Catenibacillus scindens]|uniref:Tetratricopeptide (TPR) repeat protein n=1 Tax=Catenibacillus scindens TaxID=673271 RepID=A0A7W8H9X2_9FIRM|nr:DUF5716 family protein [Catenibacillus scindens]MBB5264591.1 tetratricopeptide (TPR) repeat protein [Catenibacillus scindens]
MSETVTKLWTGYDLGNTYSQISCYNERKNDVDSICLPGKKNAYEIPTRLCFNKKDGTWVFGEDAVPDKGREWIFVKDFLVDYEAVPQIMAGDQVFEKKELLYEFIRLSLELIRRYYPHGQVQWLTFTSRSFSKTLIDDLMEFGTRLGVSPGCLKIQTHVASYENYALCQPKELWSHDVGLFEYDENGLIYCHLSISRKHSPVVVVPSLLDLSAYLGGSDYKTLAPPELDRRFLDVIKEVLGKRNVSTIYLVGEGFDGDWLNLSIKTMCSNRKGFIGQNLFSKGACYTSMLEATQKKNQQFIALCDEMIPVSIYISVNRGRERFTVDLVKAGSDWYNLQENVEFIMDGTDTVPLHVRDFVSNKEKVIPLKLENMPDRPNRTTRIRMHLEFEDANICQVIMEDQGFGALYPATDKTWKMRLNVTEYQASNDFIPEGRLILNREVAEAVPFYFHISGMKVYSVEELCYYIYENIYAVTLDIFGEDFFYWLEKKMNEPVLAKSLKNLIKAGASLKEVVRYLMNFTDYYSQEECKKLLGIIDDLSRQNPTEAKKLMADNYIRYCRYVEAIACYCDVIYEMEHVSGDDVTRDFKGNTWHNLGVAYTRLMNFQNARDCFIKAWHLNQNEESLKCLLWTAKLLGDETTFFDAVENSSMEQDEVEAIVNEFDQVEADSKSDKNEKMKAVHDIFEDKTGEGYRERRDAYLSGLKQWYRG